MPSKEDLAYAAGIMDGEGCIGIYRQRKPKPNHSIEWDVRIQVCMTDLEVPAWLHSTFGGHLYTQHSRGVHHWQLWGGVAQPFLELILPYLKIKTKSEQARLAIEFRGLKKPSGSYGKGRFKSLALQQAEETLANRMHSLHQKEL